MNVIGTAGHVDHGKSTLVERLTGIDPDRFAEEKRRGLTIDLGFAWLQLPSGREIGLIDVPGHERFIKNMLAGAGGITVCLFVVAANEGWKPQSAEHLSILDILDIRHGVVALTKSDTVDDETLLWAEEEVKERLAHSSLADAPVVACSATTGAGIPELLDALDKVVGAAPPSPDLGRPRLWIDRVFTIAGAGTVVTGTLAGGVLSVGDEVELAPEGRRARIRTIQSHKKSVDSIGPGNRVALNLVGLDRQGAERGDAVVTPRRWRPTDRVDVEIRVLAADIAGVSHELTEKGAHLLYVGSAETPVRVKLLGRDRLQAGERGYAQLYLRDPLPLGRGDRFVLRDAGRVLTFGGGVILDPLPSRARRDDTERVDLLSALRDVDAAGAFETLLEAEGVLGMEEAALRSGLATVPEGATRLGSDVVSGSRLESLQRDLRAAVAAFHEDHPMEPGAPRAEIRAALAIEPDVLDALIATTSDVEADGTTVRATSHRAAFAPEERAVRDRLVAALNEARFTPPFTKELDVAPELVRALVNSGELVRIGDFHLTRALADEARSTVRNEIAARGPMTVAQIRDLLQTSRKYAVPLCEWLDSTGATRRQGDLRALGPTP